MTRQELETRFLIDCDDTEWFGIIYDIYNEDTRYYHTPEHILSMFKNLDTYGGKVNDKMSVKWAIWFHDFVNNPKEGDNEERSVTFFELFALNRLSKKTIEKAKRMILATKTHNSLHIKDIDDLSEEDKYDLFFFLDLDLAVLSSTDAEYSLYSLNIRYEYEPVVKNYLCRRFEFLTDLLTRQKIYFLDIFSQDDAVKNIEKECSTLCQSWKNNTI